MRNCETKSTSGTKLHEVTIGSYGKPDKLDTYLTSRVSFLSKKLSPIWNKAKQLNKDNNAKVEIDTSVGKLIVFLDDTGIRVTLKKAGKSACLSADFTFRDWEKYLGHLFDSTPKPQLPFVLSLPDRRYYSIKGHYTDNESSLVRRDYGEELNDIATALKECNDLEKLVDDAIKSQKEADLFSESFNDWYDVLQQING
jgi:hypothetical protein